MKKFIEFQEAGDVVRVLNKKHGSLMPTPNAKNEKEGEVTGSIPHCMCHDELVEVIPNEKDPNKIDYFCPITNRQLFEFNYKSKEKDMAFKRKKKETLEDTRPGEEGEFGGLSEEEKPTVVEEDFLPDEEEKAEVEQPFLFKDDKVYNELHLTRIDLEDAIKRTDKKLYHMKAERKVLAKRQKENKEAVEIYEKLRTDEE